MGFIDFAAVRTLVPIETVLKWYRIETKPHGEILRGNCPICDSDSKRCFLVTPAKNLFHCFSCKKGGDSIQLFAFLEECSNKQAAEKMLERFANPKPRRR
jgi:DNA primase